MPGTHRLRVVLLLVGGALAPMELTAQALVKGDQYFGLIGGTVGSQLTGDGVESSDAQYSAAFGLDYTYAWSRHLGFSANLVFLQRRSLSTLSDGNRLDLDLNEITVPAQVVAVLPIGPSVSLAARTGLSFGFPVRCRAGLRGSRPIQDQRLLGQAVDGFIV